jgi:protein TonB
MTAGALILPDPDGAVEFRRWSLAALIVLAAHFGLMGTYFLLPAPEAEGSPDAPVVVLDFAPVPEAPASQFDIAPGPEMQEAQPTSKPPPQAEPEVVEPTPKMESPAPAEVTLPQPEPKAAEKKPEQNPDTEKSIIEAVQQSVPAPQTTAPTRSERNNAAVPRAPSPGSGASRDATLKWQTLVAARLQQNKRYPAGAGAQHQQGTATLAFSVDREGRILSKRISRSSGHELLDDEALAMLQRAQPLPAFLPGMTQNVMHVTQALRFLPPN